MSDYPKDSLSNAAQKVNNNLPVCPILVLCDNSGTMMNYNDTLNKALIKLVDDLKNDSSVKNNCVVDLCIMSFHVTCDIVLDFTRLSDIRTSDIKPIAKSDLATFYGNALKESIDKLAAMKQMYKDADIRYLQPNLIVISDGKPEHEKPEDTIAGINAVKEKIAKERWTCVPLFVGSKSSKEDLTYLKKISVPDENGNGDVIEFKENSKTDSIVQCLQYVSASVATIIGHNGKNNAGVGQNIAPAPLSTSELKRNLNEIEKINQNLERNKKYGKKSTFGKKLKF